MSTSDVPLKLKTTFVESSLLLVAFFISFWVLVGWKLNIPELVQFPANAVPVQFNTALGLLLVSIAPVLFINRPAFAKVCLGAVLFIGITALIQYLFNIELGVDELLHNHSLTTKTSHPGRMAPNSAANFILISVSICLLLFVKRKVLNLMIGSTLASIVFTLSLIAIVGYIFDINAAYSLGTYTHMSLITAFCFLLISANCLYLFKLKVGEADVLRFYQTQVVAIFLFFVTLLISSTVEKQITKYQKDELKSYVLASQEMVNLRWHSLLVQLQNHSLNSSYSNRSDQQKITNSKYVIATFKNGGKVIYSKGSSFDFVDKLPNSISKLKFERYSNNIVGPSITFDIANMIIENGSPIVIVRLQNAFDEGITIRQYYVVDIVAFKQEVMATINDHLNSQFEVKALDHEIIQQSDEALFFPYSKHTNLIANHRTSDTFFSYEQLPLLILILGSLITVLVATILFFIQRLRYQTLELEEQTANLDDYKRALNETNATLTLAAQVAELGIWRWHVDSGALTWDERMFEIYDTSEEVKQSGLLYEYWYDTVHPDDRDKAASSLQSAVENNQIWHEHFRIVLKNGEVRHVKASALTTFDKNTNSKVVIGGNLDVTYEYSLREELIKQTEQAEQHSLSKSQFLANMSHEIRTPMNAILGISDLLSSTDLNQQQRKFIDLIIGSAENLMALINDILDLSKIEAGELKIETLSFPLEEVLFDATKIMSARAHEKKLNFYCTIDNSVPMYIESDPVRLSQIVINLISNAIKFTEKGQITLQVHKCEIENRDYEFGIELVVKDSGVGIAEERLDDVLKPFTQSDASTTRNYGGTGLGLAIVTELTELLNGQLSIESKVGEGTEVSVKIPIKLPTGVADKSKVSATFEEFANYKNKSNLFTSLNVLLLDPHELNRNWVSDMLHSWGSNVEICKDEQDLKSLTDQNSINQRKYDVVILNNAAGDSFVSKAFANLEQLTTGNAEEDTFVIIQIPTTLVESDYLNKNNIQFISSPIKQSELFNLMLTRFVEEKSSEDKVRAPQIDDSLVKHVLVAEDHEVNQIYVREILEGRGHRCTIVHNGREAFEAVQKQTYDMVLMDVQMPVMDGITATEKIRELFTKSELHIIGLTARALKNDLETCLAAGMNDYLTKPVLPKKLLEVIESVESNSAESNDALASTSETEQSPSSSDTKVIDLTLCELATGGNKELFKKLLTIAIDSSKIHREKIKQFINDEDWESLSNEIHKMIGMIGNFVFEEVNNQARNLEAKVNKSIEQKSYSEATVQSVINLLVDFQKDAVFVLASLED